MNFHDVLIKTPINERYSFIRKIYEQNKNDITQTSKILEISYNTVSKAVKETQKKEFMKQKYKKNILCLFMQKLFSIQQFQAKS